MQRYFVEHPIRGSHVRLEGDQARHLVQVMRAEPGRNVVLFDGEGDEFRANVERVARGKVELLIVERHSVDRETAAPVVLGVALPKGDRQRWLVEKVVEIGVRRLVPLRSRRGVAQPVPSAVQRLRRAVVEASKQCGRNRLMEIAEAEDAKEYFQQAPEPATRWISHPAAEPLELPPPVSSGDRQTAGHEPVYLAVGPEGGWNDEEVAAAESSGWQVVGLGPRILRVETAAVVLATLALWR